MKPIYAENIIVAIKSCGCVEWYILDKEYCFLDYPKLEEAYRKKGYNDKLAYNPSILIDFENRVFISYYPEPESFEAFVPDGWIGKYQDFTEEIPEKQRYWMDENGKNLIGE